MAKSRLTKVAESIGGAIGKAERTAHKVAKAGVLAKKELEALSKEVDSLKKRLQKTTKRLKNALRKFAAPRRYVVRVLGPVLSRLVTPPSRGRVEAS